MPPRKPRRVLREPAAKAAAVHEHDVARESWTAGQVCSRSPSTSLGCRIDRAISPGRPEDVGRSQEAMAARPMMRDFAVAQTCLAPVRVLPKTCLARVCSPTFPC
jgi:hypothetical protein